MKGTRAVSFANHSSNAETSTTAQVMPASAKDSPVPPTFAGPLLVNLYRSQIYSRFRHPSACCWRPDANYALPPGCLRRPAVPCREDRTTSAIWPSRQAFLSQVEQDRSSNEYGGAGRQHQADVGRGKLAQGRATEKRQWHDRQKERDRGADGSRQGPVDAEINQLGEWHLLGAASGSRARGRRRRSCR